METAAETGLSPRLGLGQFRVISYGSHRGLHSYAAPRLITIALYRCVTQRLDLAWSLGHN